VISRHAPVACGDSPCRFQCVQQRLLGVRATIPEGRHPNSYWRAGVVSNLAALNFAVRLYKSLAVGLSLYEALTYAGLYVVQPGRSYYECD